MDNNHLVIKLPKESGHSNEKKSLWFLPLKSQVEQHLSTICTIKVRPKTLNKPHDSLEDTAGSPNLRFPAETWANLYTCQADGMATTYLHSSHVDLDTSLVYNVTLGLLD